LSVPTGTIAAVTFVIRTARPEEFETIGEITVRAYVEGGFVSSTTSGYAVELRQAADRARCAELLVALDGDEVVGSVTVARHGGAYAEIARPGEVEFRMLAVAPEAAGRGAGRSLVRAVLDYAHAEGSARVVLCSLETMAVAHRLYRRMGFARLPDRDWQPEPGVRLLAFGCEPGHTP
jgi:predicted N-acetyltransferase YhbS